MIAMSILNEIEISSLKERIQNFANEFKILYDRYLEHRDLSDIEKLVEEMCDRLYIYGYTLEPKYSKTIDLDGRLESYDKFLKGYMNTVEDDEIQVFVTETKELGLALDKDK